MVKIVSLLVILICARASLAEDVIKKAQAFALQKNRTEAIQILVSAIKNHPQKLTSLSKALNEMSTIFYTEKGQKLFEYAKSLEHDSPNEAVEKLQEALLVEPDNLLVQLWQERLLLMKGKCSDAFLNAQKGLDVNPYFLPMLLLKTQARVCLQKNDESQKNIADLKKIEHAYPSYFHVLSAQEALNRGDFFSANLHLHKAEQIDKAFPEIYFWKTQVLAKENKDIKEAATKYVSLCKNMTKKDFLRYELEPRTCIEYKNFELEHKNILDQENKKDL